MGQLALPTAGGVYVDTCSVIYAVEQIEPYQTTARPLWDALHSGQIEVTTSELTLLEVLVKPLRDGNSPLASLYRSVLLGTAGLSCQPVSREVLERAAEIRAAYGLRTPDAIHAAASLVAACSLFVTNDPGFRRVPGLTTAVLAEIAAS